MIREVDMSQLSDVTYVCTCVSCQEKQFLDGEGISTSDGWEVCSNKCLQAWEGNRILESTAPMNDKCVFCNGKGKIARFHHIDNGRCYRCGGTGKKGKSLH